MIGINAEASSSRQTLDASSRPRRASNANTTTTPASPTTPKPPSTTASQRKVRTVPPSAVFDPPTPTEENPPAFDSAFPTQRRPARPKHSRKLRYVSTDDSSDDEYDDTDDDDEPPWWTFTARGMSKLRAMRGLGDHGGDSPYESGREAPVHPPKETHKRKRRSRSRDPYGRTPDRMESGDSHNWSGGERRGSANKLFNHRPFRLPAAIPRRSTEHSRATQASPKRPDANSSTLSTLTRSNSAPGAPPNLAEGIERTDTPEPIVTDGGEDAVVVRPSPRRSSTASMRRFLPTRTRSSVDGVDSFTDSETAMAASPRLRAKQRMFAFSGVPEESGVVDLSDDLAPGSTTPHGTPTTPTPHHHRMRRLNANNLRIRLPPPITQHFANGWPHAGSWQDALRTGDVFEEHSHGGTPGVTGAPRGTRPASLKSPPSLKNYPAFGRPASLNRPSSLKSPGHTTPVAQTIPSPGGQTPPPPAPATYSPPAVVLQREADGNGTSTDTDGGGRVFEKPVARPPVHRLATETRPRPKRKQKKAKRYGRYRPAQLPPTPGGLGFTPSIRSEKSSSWQQVPEPPADHENVNPFDRIDEEYMLSPQASRLSEKGSSGSWGWCFVVRRARQKRALDGLTVHQRIRRMLFLDARITIYIRLFNLAIVTTLLALAVTIRRRLHNVGLPGIIGPSTTLIIAYAAFTMLHVLTAMYREYFGRPIGLWGLRSKMLWVCLDLLFVALWSSAMTLAVNDYIDTPLDCTTLSPWWTKGNVYTTVRRSLPPHISSRFNVDTPVPEYLKTSPEIADVCRRQVACFSISLVALLLYCGNMVLSLFRIFETVRRTASGGRGVIAA